MQVINNVTNLPVIRPVACLDKLEIIDISKKIGIDETRNVLQNWFTLFHTNDDSILE